MYAYGVQPRHEAKCNLFVEEGLAFFDKLKGRLCLQPAFGMVMNFSQSEQCSQLWTLNFSGS